MTHRMSVAAVMCAACTAVLLGQQTPPPGTPRQDTSSPPVFRSGVEAVQVDVYVTDENDKPVSGLTADDFEVFENGKPQVIATFAPVTIPFSRAEALPFNAEPDVQTNNRPEGHVYLFLLSNTEPDWALRARYLLRKFITEHFGDNDIAAVVTGRTFPGDRQDFTSNRRLLLAAVDRFAGEGFSVRELRELMETMASIPGGRKSVLWLTSAPLIDPFALLDYRGGVLQGEGEDAHAMMAIATRANIRFYVINPRGLSWELGSGGAAGGSSKAWAELTGGFSLTNSNTFDAAFERLSSETSMYYVLGFNSTGQKRDGRFVRLEVKARRPGLKVKSRSGYLDHMEYVRRRITPEPQRSPVEAALANPLATAGVPMRVFAAPYRKAGRNATVALAIDLDASALTFSEKNGAFSASLEVRHLATDVNHKIYPEYRHRTTISLDASSYQRVMASGVRIVSQFEVPKGRYQVRVASASGARNGSVVYDLDVPDFTDGSLAMSGVSLAALAPAATVTLRPDTIRRTDQKSKQCRSSVCDASVVLESTLTPWLANGNPTNVHLLRDVLPAPPTTARAFAPHDTLVMFAEVYDNNGRVRKDPAYTIELSARLYNENGELVRLVTERRPTRGAKRRSGGHGFTLRLPLDNAPAGSYVLHFEARSDRSDDHRTDRNIPIRVM